MYYEGMCILSVFSAGDAGRGKRERPLVCGEGAEERCAFSGWGHRERNGGAESSGIDWPSTLPHISLLRLPDWGVYCMCVYRENVCCMCTHLRYAPYTRIIPFFQCPIFPDGTAAVFLLQAILLHITAFILTQMPLLSLQAAYWSS